MASNPSLAASLAEHTAQSPCPLSKRQELRKTVVKTGQITHGERLRKGCLVSALNIIANAEALFYPLALNKFL